MKGRSRKDKASARTRRAKIGVKRIASTIATFQSSCPITDTSAMPSTKTGKDWMKSNIRMTSVLAQPR